MKISVITQHTVNNYGSVLQTYATSEVLKSLGHEVEFVDFCRPSNLEEVRAEKILQTNVKMQRLKPLWGMCAISRNMTHRILTNALRYNRRHMQHFLRDTVSLTPKRYTAYEEIQQEPPVADAYMTGSDQVWNSQYNEGVEKAYYLDYAPAGKRRIAFAASIGKTELEPWEIAETAELLKKYHAISVREKSACHLLEALDVASIPVLDPTMVLEAEDWRALADYRKCPNRPYLLVYQLNQDRQMDKYAEKVAQKKGWQIVRIGYHNSDKKRIGKCVFCPTVPQFLGLFDRAACCLTDSFHATAFSLNMGIDFLSVRPPRFATRIESILTLTGTDDRLVDSYDDLSPLEYPIDKAAVAKVLDRERIVALQFLRQALEK